MPPLRPQTSRLGNPWRGGLPAATRSRHHSHVHRSARCSRPGSWVHRYMEAHDENEEGRRERPHRPARDRGPCRLRRRAREQRFGRRRRRRDPCGARLPALHRLRRGWLRRQVVQPARLRGRRAGGRRARCRAQGRGVQQRERLRAEPREPRGRGLRRHRDRGLRAGVRDQGVGRRQPRHRLHPHRRRCRRRRRRRDLRRPGRPAQHQAAALRHRRRRRSWPATSLPTTPRPVSSAPTAGCRSRP